MFKFCKFRFLTSVLSLMLAGLAPFHACAQEQFNLICKIHGRKVIDYKADLNQGEGDNAPWDWHETFRYAIDLKNKRYLGLDWINQTPWKIVRVTKTRIWFSEGRDGFERYNLVTNRYYSRAHGATFIIFVTTGKCHRARFSGFGAVAPRQN